MNLNNVIIVISLRKDEGMKMNIAIIDDLQEEIDKLKEILYLILDYPHKYYTFKHFDV